MEFLKKRSSAFIVMVVIMVIGVIFGLNRSYKSFSKEIEDQFYSGIDGETPISTYLENRFKAAKMIVIIADEYSEVKSQRDRLYDAYNDLYAADSISEKYKYNDEMEKAFDELYAALTEQVNISAKHNEDLKSYADTMMNTQDKILRSSYNEKVDEYFKQIKSFPAGLLRLFIFADAPEYFA